MDQRKIYNEEIIYSDYAKREYLFKAEERIISEMALCFKDMDMLDMGVGGGRTTKYFAPVVKSYIGADYAINMVNVCKKKFKGKIPFIECDVRDMREIEDESFDFVLFSFNGIDSFGHKDRKTALNEIYRILKKDGYFCFSSHNLGWKNLYSLFSIEAIHKETDGLISKVNRIAKRSLSIIRLNFLNKSLFIRRLIERLRVQGWGLLYDNSLKGKAIIYYITYQEQLNQLEQAGFCGISSYDLDGNKTDNENKLNSGGWIYYLCRVKK